MESGYLASTARVRLGSVTTQTWITSPRSLCTANSDTICNALPVARRSPATCRCSNDANSPLDNAALAPGEADTRPSGNVSLI